MKIKEEIKSKLNKVTRNEGWEGCPTKLFDEIGLKYFKKEYGYRNNQTDGEIHIIYYIGFNEFTHLLDFNGNAYDWTSNTKKCIIRSDCTEICKEELEYLKSQYNFLKEIFKNNNDNKIEIYFNDICFEITSYLEGKEIISQTRDHRDELMKMENRILNVYKIIFDFLIDKEGRI